MGNEVTGVVNEQDGTIVIKDAEGKEIRYAKESDLLTIKGSRDDLQVKLAAAEAARGTATTEADTKIAEANQQKLQAEAKAESLTEEIKKHTGTAEELVSLKAQLATAQQSGEEQGNKLLELRRTFITNTYKVPPATVAEKTLTQLDVFEEALKAVGAGTGGNYAFGGAGGGANALEGKSPLELAKMFYTK